MTHRQLEGQLGGSGARHGKPRRPPLLALWWSELLCPTAVHGQAHPTRGSGELTEGWAKPAWSTPGRSGPGLVWLSRDGSHLWLAGTGVDGRAERERGSCFQVHGPDLGAGVGEQEVPISGPSGQRSHHPDLSPY